MKTCGTYSLASLAQRSSPGAPGVNSATSSVLVKTCIRPGMIDSIASANSDVTISEAPSCSSP
jgi:hypothetical protein